MTSQMGSGKVLRDARERKGYDLNTVARRLRIRPDILRAIEEGDFNAMPPRGYTRNMVNAYARLLGLNPTEIVNMYLDEAYAQQVQRARGSEQGSGFIMARENRQTRNRVGNAAAQAASENRSYEADRTTAIRNGSTQRTRVLYDDGTRYSRDDYGVTRERSPREGKSERDFLSHHSGYPSSNFNFLDERIGKGSQRSIHVGQTPMEWTASRLPSFLQSRIALVVAAAIVLIVVIVIAVNVIGGRHAQPEEDVSQLPVSGVADTTGSSDSSASSAAVEIAPTSARVIYSVASGDECYVETYTNGQIDAETLSGPVERSVEVTGNWIITTWSPETLTVQVDGAKVTLQPDANYGGMYSYTVDFPTILNQWRVAHGMSATAASTTTTAQNATNANGVSTQQGQRDYTQQMTDEDLNYTDDGSYDESQDYGEEQQEYDEDGSYEEPQEYYDESQDYGEEY